ncbi:RagB/SusD family nutrient uptake outer membrane protein [Butyricimonas sp. Marseille-P3923]|uniref:RagB/SusD family nutrient uptake outer membrane protein n=1 Tax=Butyricimonas sp. Marseille-P3923 TaxID=1987504 RepID=UPI000C06908C|nr:RagB/SusD family nutrient uptake outer membrane protein [Butyricimonas sp. Marseille-P3923]
MNRKMKYSLLVSVVLFLGCKDFLEPKSQSEYVPRVVQSLDELLLGDAYHSPVQITSNMLYSTLGLFDDDVAARPDMTIVDESENDFNKALLAFSWSKDMFTKLSGFGNAYASSYRLIMGCNAVLDYLDDVAGTIEEKNDVKAQALALRSFYYFHLVNLYGKPYSVDKKAPGVPLKLTSRLSTDAMPRSTVERIYDQITGDLREAERLIKTLPDEKQLRKNKRVNLPFIQLLLSRVYLYMENWEDAMRYAETVINNYDYMIKDLNTVKEPDRNSNLSYPNYYDWNNSEVIFMLGDLNDIISLAITSVTVVVTEGTETFKKSTVVCVASDDLINSYDPNDLRKTRYLVWESITSKQSGPKYRIPVSKLKVGTDYNFNTGWGNDWGIAFKITEAYLNAAEAAAMVYKTEGDAVCQTKALQWLDKLREKRYPTGTYIELTVAKVGDLVEFVRAERRRELCFEHHRWFDLRRYGMEKLKHVWYDRNHNPIEYVLEKNDPGFTLMLPASAFENNPALEQNDIQGEL